MEERATLLESALDSLPDGLAVFGAEDHVVVWNQAAEAITGFACAELLTREVPRALGGLLQECAGPIELGHPSRGALVRVRHKLGHEVPVMMRALVLRDGLGVRIGLAAIFHPAESLDALPH